MTRILPTRPAAFSSATERMVSMASSLALSMKPQVFTTTTSLPAQSSCTVMPDCRHRAIICSVFTRFCHIPGI